MSPISRPVNAWIFAAASFIFFPRRLPSTLKFALAERLTSSASSSRNSTLLTLSSSAMIGAVSSSIERDAASDAGQHRLASGWRT
jgi:hypothetical protein